MTMRLADLNSDSLVEQMSEHVKVIELQLESAF